MHFPFLGNSQLKWRRNIQLASLKGKLFPCFFCTSCDSFCYIIEAGLYEVISPYLNLWETYKKKPKNTNIQDKFKWAGHGSSCCLKRGLGWMKWFCPVLLDVLEYCSQNCIVTHFRDMCWMLKQLSAEDKKQESSLTVITAVKKELPFWCTASVSWYIIILTCYLSPGWWMPALPLLHLLSPPPPTSLSRHINLSLAASSSPAPLLSLS